MEFTVTSGLSPLASCVLGSDPWGEVVLLAGFQRVLLVRSKRPGFRVALVSLSVIFFHVYQSGSHFSNSSRDPACQACLMRPEVTCSALPCPLLSHLTHRSVDITGKDLARSSGKDLSWPCRHPVSFCRPGPVAPVPSAGPQSRGFACGCLSLQSCIDSNMAETRWPCG